MTHIFRRTAGDATTSGPPVSLVQDGFSQREIATPAGRMAVFEAGEGEPLLLLHGVGGGASSKYWYRIAPELAAGHRVIAPDWVGWGDSEHPCRAVLFDDYVTSFVALTAEIDRPVKVVAQSLAVGFVIAGMRAGAPVERLAMMAPSGGYDFGVDAFDPFVRNTLGSAARMPVLNRLLYRAVFHRRAFIADWFRRQGFYDSSAVPPVIVDAGLYSARKPNAHHSALPFLTGELRYDLAPLLADVRVPALMVWGRYERQISPDVREALQRVNPAIDVALIDRARSNIEVEHPRDTLAALEPFLRAA